MNELLKDRIVWIVGASGAIGAEIARHVAGAGAIAIVSARSEGRLRELASEIKTAGGRAEVVPCNIRSRHSVDAAAKQIIDAHGRIDGLVNSTSVSDFGPFLEIDDAVWLEVLDTKLMGYVRTMRAALPAMSAQGGGAIVNISGRGGRQPTATHIPCGCASAAINLMDKGLADAFAPHGVRVNTISPGPIESDRLRELMQSAGAMSDRSVQSYAKPGTPQDVAQAALWLLSDLSRHVTGVILPVDGGATFTV